MMCEVLSLCQTHGQLRCSRLSSLAGEQEFDDADYGGC